MRARAIEGGAENVRLGFLTVERVDLATCEHVGKNEVFQNLNPLWRASLVVVLE